MSGADDSSLLEAVRRALEEAAGDLPAITRLERSQPPTSGSYRTEVLTLRLADGADDRLFLKDFGRCRHHKADMAGRRLRELCVYRDLLAEADLGMARYRGSVWDASRGRFWLLLEYVDGRRLRHLGFASWLDAARWLGRMQGHAARHDLTGNDWLLDHGAGFLSTTAERALQAVESVSPRRAARLSESLRHYDEAVAPMTAGPATMVHGYYRPYNILVRSSGAICVTDWEESARGSPFYDLAYLADGFDAHRLGLLMDGYDEGRASAGLALEDREHGLRLLRCFSIHRNLKTLTKAAGPGFSERGLELLVERTESLARRAL